jgi:ATP-binding protein involved in chromosome partitioning
MDADVYGPSIPTLTGAVPPSGGNPNRFRPAVAFGVKVVLDGLFREPRATRSSGAAPMLHKAVEQFLGQVDWGELDYLIVDLPPGTGDIQLSLCQMIPLTGAAVVSTPQDVALKVAEKAIIMFKKLNTPGARHRGEHERLRVRPLRQREDVFGVGGRQGGTRPRAASRSWATSPSRSTSAETSDSGSRS